jgi:DNA-directed RNA polymerase delta subunit
VKALRDELGGAFAFLADTSWKYRSLYGTEMPDSPTAIIREAAAQRRSPAEYAAIKYDFAGKEKAKREADQKTHDDAIRKEAKDASDREWAERVSSNPMIRQAETSRFAEVHKAVKEGARPDPLKMPTRELRHKETQQRIQKEIAENATIQ